jgi:3-oxoacyl-[acyl-carrier-protein] synthase-3
MQNRTVITGTGSFIPSVIKSNLDFAESLFYTDDHAVVSTPPREVVEKFREITGIEERRYADDSNTASDMAVKAAQCAIADSGINKEEIEQIIVAHNFGNVLKDTCQTDILPSLASRVRHGLGIANPACIPYDIIFGCPGWLQGIIQADIYIKAGAAKKMLVIGTETLSRVLDPYDRDSMIFADGAGAAIVEAVPGNGTGPGVISWSVQSHCGEEAYYLYFGKSNLPAADSTVRYIKMKGRKVYEYAMKHVPLAMKDCLDKAGVPITGVRKFFIHQANEKMDQAIVQRLFKLYGIRDIPDDIMPMNIHKLGNSSVATIPTLYDMVRKNSLEDHAIEKGDIVLFASVGAGMNINAVCYRV